MKNLFLLSIFMLSVLIALSQSSSPCVSCNDNVIDSVNYSSALGVNNTSDGIASLASGKFCNAIGDYSGAFGYGSEANEMYSFAFGKTAIANEKYSFAFGKYTESLKNASFSLGTYLRADNAYAFVIGKGAGYSFRLINQLENTLMIGFNSTLPTLFVSPSAGSNFTGKIGIGNITEPETKLHIKADLNEDASIMLQPTGPSYYARLLFGQSGHQISSKLNGDLEFISTIGKDFLFENGNIGIDTYNPIAKIQVKNGDIFIEDIDHGIVMKSPDGNCWRGTLDNSGLLNFVQVSCNDLLTGSIDQTTNLQKQISIYPNPTGNKVFISINPKITHSSFEILAVNGKIMDGEPLTNSKSYVDIEHYESGLYIINIKDLNGKILASEKVIKQ